MSRREGLRLLAAGVLTVWLCLFLHWENTEKSMIRALLVETKDDSWTVGLLYQFPEASADSSEAEAAIRLCVGRTRCGVCCLSVRSCSCISPAGGWRPGCSGRAFR